jgi:hypothetical protein
VSGFSQTTAVSIAPGPSIELRAAASFVETRL